MLDLQFNTAEHIVKTNAKILMLHSEDDSIIPIYHSRELKEICDRQRPRDYPPVRLVEFEKIHGLGHNNIYKYSEIYPMIKFVFGLKV
jgi:predicted esterase